MRPWSRWVQMERAQRLAVTAAQVTPAGLEVQQYLVHHLRMGLVVRRARKDKRPFAKNQGWLREFQYQKG